MLRWRMLRHGAHHVNIWSLSGSSARPTSTRPCADDPLELLALLRQLADRAWLALLRMHVHVGARDVQVAADHERDARAVQLLGANCSSAARKRILAGKSLPPFGTYTDATVSLRQLHGHDAVLVVEGRMRERRTLRRDRLADVQADARVALCRRASSTSSLRSRTAQTGSWSGDALISCRQTTSAARASIHSCTCAWRARMPLTFQVAIFIVERALRFGHV